MGAATHPQAMVGTEGVDYIIAFRYCCSNCTAPKAAGGKTSSFTSTSTHIMKQLPLHLVMEFPAILTHRRAISKELFSIMRSCFHSNGMGSKQFADILCVQASHRYDEMDLRYHAGILHQRKHGSLLSHKYPKFPSHNDQSLEGLHDYSPSSQLLQDIYDKLIEEFEGEIDQLMSMIKVTVGAVDHSHKVSYIILFINSNIDSIVDNFQLNGVPIYIGLYSMTNELGQLQVCDLVATKAHSQIEPHLHQVSASLDFYGFPQPEVIYIY
jgi:hypothetical protein